MQYALYTEERMVSLGSLAKCRKAMASLIAKYETYGITVVPTIHKDMVMTVGSANTGVLFIKRFTKDCPL